MRSIRMPVHAGLCLAFLAGVACGGGDPVPRVRSMSLDGTYETTIARAVLDEFHPEVYPADVFAGTYTLVVEGSTYRLSGGGFGRITGRIITTEGSLSFADIPAPVGAFNCVDDTGARADTREEGTAIYSYEVNGDSLVLRIRDEPCAFRGVLMERTWDRVTRD